MANHQTIKETVQSPQNRSAYDHVGNIGSVESLKQMARMRDKEMKALLSEQ